jgi:hypothetical protein
VVVPLDLPPTLAFEEVDGLAHDLFRLLIEIFTVMFPGVQKDHRSSFLGKTVSMGLEDRVSSLG